MTGCTHVTAAPTSQWPQSATCSLYPLALAHDWPPWKLPKESLVVTRASNFLLVSPLTLLIRSWQEIENDSTMSSTLTNSHLMMAMEAAAIAIAK